MKIICLGHASYDVTMPLDFYPEENSKNRIPALVECGGGPASNAAYLLGKWDCDVHFSGKVGNDMHGKVIRKEFSEVNVDTTYLEMDSFYTTAISHIISNTQNGSRTIMTYKDSHDMTEVEIDLKPDIILIDGQEYFMSKKILEKNPNAIKVIDAGRANNDIVMLSEMCDYVVCSKVFAEGVTNLKFDYRNVESIKNIYNILKNKFKGKVIVTLEDKGSLYEVDGKIKIMPSINVNSVDSTGAGDIYHGAFVYGLSKNMDLEEIIKLSNVTGALSTTKVGGRYSVPSKDEVRDYINDFR
jgi:Sugar kinases, ribokinase family